MMMMVLCNGSGGGARTSQAHAARGSGRWIMEPWSYIRTAGELHDTDREKYLLTVFCW